MADVWAGYELAVQVSVSLGIQSSRCIAGAVLWLLYPQGKGKVPSTHWLGFKGHKTNFDMETRANVILARYKTLTFWSSSI
jgi:hypothetical protein